MGQVNCLTQWSESMKKRMRTGNKGFTLIEVILSIAILSLISVPLINYFTDSLKYSVKTREKQNATLTAQETIEFLKAQEVLMKWVGAEDAGGNTVMHYDITDEIKQEFGVPLDQKIEGFDAAHPSTEYDRNAGKGTLVYNYSVTPSSYEKGFDVRVTLQTDTGATEIARPMVYGIDDTTNVVAAEYNEEEEAMMYFMAQNEAAIIQLSGGYIIGETPSPAPSTTPSYTVAPGGPSASATTTPTATPNPFAGVTIQTEDQIKENIRRTIHVDLDLVTAGTDTFYTVRVYYEYSCININSIDPTKPCKFTSNDIIDTSVKELEGFYLMFNKVHLTEDRIEFKWVGSEGKNPPTGDYPEIRLICQDIDIAATSSPDPSATPAAATTMPGAAVDAYVPKLYFENFTGWDWHPEVRTNIKFPSTFEIDTSSQIADKTLTVKELTESGNPVRVFKITVDIYRLGERDAGKAPLIEMITSKTE